MKRKRRETGRLGDMIHPLRPPALKSGFSLLEVLIAMVIIGSLLAALYSTFFTSHTVYVSGSRLADLQNKGRIILDSMAHDLRASSLSSIVLGTANGSSSVSFQADTGFSGGAIVWGPPTIFQVDAKSRVVRTVPSNPPPTNSPVALTADVAMGGLVMILTGDKLSISLTLTGVDDQGRPISATSQTSVMLRN